MTEVCESCGRKSCICGNFVEDMPEEPYYHSKYCILGTQYKIIQGKDYPKSTKHIYDMFAEQWYDTEGEAQSARQALMLKELNQHQNRIKWLERQLGV